MTVQFDIDLTQLEFLGDRIIGEINKMREIDPIFWSEHEQSWFICGHEEVAEAFRAVVPLSAERHKLIHFIMPDEADRAANIPTFMRLFPHFLINLNGPAQSRLRRLVSSAFTKRVADQYAPLAREVITAVLDALEDGAEIEFVDEVARQITGRNIMRITGMENEEAYLPQLQRWAYYANGGGSGRPSRELLIETEKCFVEMEEALLPLVQARRANPSDDFISLLLKPAEDGETLSDDEVVANLILVLLAGHDTTLNTMSMSVAALARNHDAMVQMRDNPDNLLNAILELMRFIAMSTEQGRIVARDFEWKGHAFKAGQPVHIMTAGANRDPKVFHNPETLDLNRPQEKNMTFGPGVHHCIGHFFAKMQLMEFFTQFLQRYDRVELLEDEIHYGPSLTFRGPTATRVKLYKR